LKTFINQTLVPTQSGGEERNAILLKLARITGLMIPRGDHLVPHAGLDQQTPGFVLEFKGGVPLLSLEPGCPTVLFAYLYQMLNRRLAGQVNTQENQALASSLVAQELETLAASRVLFRKTGAVPFRWEIYVFDKVGP
jgi:hypothetical protein